MEQAPIIRQPRLSIFRRIQYGIKLWLLKALVTVALRAAATIKAAKTKKTAPTYIKHYPVRPMLHNRVYIPSSWTSGTKLPLYINVHGGGFALADPSADDVFCHFMANKHDFCVVSLDYRKSPIHPFPVPVHDLGELVQAVLADSDLPVDTSKVVMGGFSAGGNLVLAVSQLKELRGKVRALVPIYPIVDFSGKYTGQYKRNKEGKKDLLEGQGAMFVWGYVPIDQDRCDPLLSPIYAPRDQLPSKLFFVAAEYDVLCQEADTMAQKLAGWASSGETPPDPHNWSRNGIKWSMVPDVQHGWTHIEESGGKEIKRKALSEKINNEIADWIKGEVFV